MRTDGRTDGPTDTAKQIVAFGNFAKAPKNLYSIQRYGSLINKVFKKLDSNVGLLETLCEIPTWLLTFQERLTFPELFTNFTYYSFFISESL
jgi:hypothetical protein